ncbi:MAG: MOSC domain-containing protein, partial [Solirubrobacterales bacterium]|nr:MOSC domain-containing protein [Solirubrobacterales bacterium]
QRPVTLVRLPGGQQDRPATLLVTVEGSRRAAQAALGVPLDLRRFRPNLHLDLDAEPYDEEGWIGRRLRVGQAELEVMQGCVRCVIPTRDPDTQAKWPGLMRWLAAERAMTFGVIVRATGPAVVRQNDPVALL